MTRLWSKLALVPATRPERQACFRRRLVKDADVHRPGRLPSTSAPSARLRWASLGTRHRSHDFAVASRLPTPVRRSAWERLDPLPSGKRPSVARRLLQSIQPASTTARSPEPRPARSRERTSQIPPWGTVTARATSLNADLTRHEPSSAEPDSTPDQPAPDAHPGWIRPLRSNSSRGLTGQGPDGFRRPGALRRDCSRQRLRPDPIRSNTSCRERVTMVAGEAITAGCSRVVNTCYEPT
jgi:hypothetical protein